MDVRPFELSDRVACLAVFDSLTPDLLEASARPQFESWLDGAPGNYLVMEHESSIVGCGGYLLSPDGSVATLRWGMIRRDSQRMGLGRFLLMYRIREIGRHGTVGVVLMEAPDPSAGFYVKQGFRVNGTAGRGWVELTKKLTVCP